MAECDGDTGTDCALPTDGEADRRRRQRFFQHLAFASVVTISMPACADRAPSTPIGPSVTCLASGDETTINAALSGAAGVAVLCPGAVFELGGPVVFDRDGQQLYTEGRPPGTARATLRVAAPSLATAIVAVGRNDIRISHVVVDGGRAELGWLPGSGSLIEMGGDASGQRIEFLRAFEPRGWSSVHVAEGRFHTCSGATIANNEIGPAGQGNEQWADGISLACRASLVLQNTITDATDGGIVVFGAPGSVILGNAIRAVTRPLLGGIAMVDYDPFDGDFTGTVVDSNVIEGAGNPIRIGIAMGTETWNCRPGAPRLSGAIVSHNVLIGEMGYGYAVNGVTDWTVMDNVSHARHSGTPVLDCAGRLPSAPGPFQVAREHSSGTFQVEFTDAVLDWALFAFGHPGGQPLRLRR